MGSRSRGGYKTDENRELAKETVANQKFVRVSFISGSFLRRRKKMLRLGK